MEVPIESSLESQTETIPTSEVSKDSIDIKVDDSSNENVVIQNQNNKNESEICVNQTLETENSNPVETSSELCDNINTEPSQIDISNSENTQSTIENNSSNIEIVSNELEHNIQTEICKDVNSSSVIPNTESNESNSIKEDTSSIQPELKTETINVDSKCIHEITEEEKEDFECRKVVNDHMDASINTMNLPSFDVNVVNNNLVNSVLDQFKEIDHYKSPYYDAPLEEPKLLDNSLQPLPSKSLTDSYIQDPFLSLPYYLDVCQELAQKKSIHFERIFRTPIKSIEVKDNETISSDMLWNILLLNAKNYIKTNKPMDLSPSFPTSSYMLSSAHSVSHISMGNESPKSMDVSNK